MSGLIPTVPEGAIRNERTYSADPLENLPELVRMALRNNWATPDEAKRVILGRLLDPFFNDQTIIDRSGNLVKVPTSPELLNKLARTIMELDQRQFERDNPEAAGKAKGSTINGVPTSGAVAVNVSLQSNKLAVQVIRDHFETVVGLGLTSLPEPIRQLPGGPPRFDGDTEAGAVAKTNEGDGE